MTEKQESVCGRGCSEHCFPIAPVKAVLLHGKFVETFLLIIILLQTVNSNWYSVPLSLARLNTWAGETPDGAGARVSLSTVERFTFGTGFDLYVNYKLS